jgi:hypothetical protein
MNIKERDCRVYDVPFKWQLPSPPPTGDFTMAVPKSAKKKMAILLCGQSKMAFNFAFTHFFIMNERFPCMS